MEDIEDITVVVNGLLTQLATAREVSEDAVPADIVLDSLDQMRLLVGLEERLDVVFDVVDLEPLDLSSREALVKSVEKMLADSGQAL